MEVEQHAVLGADACGTVEEIDDLLVVAVHEIDLEALDAHFGEVAHDALHVAVEGVVAGPEDDPDIPLTGVRH